MAPSRRDDGLSEQGHRDEASDRSDRPPLDGDYLEVSTQANESSSDHPQSSARTSGSAGDGFADRLRDVFRGEVGGGGVAPDGEEEAVLRWLRALDLQVVGACRADERLKPLLKLNVSSGAAEDRLLAQLNQHFEASEVGMLARYLCVPLVSIRVGKVTKEGSLLCPTAVRGQLNLNLLASSNMRLSFTGDDGHTERLAHITNDLDSCDVVIEEISADSSGRSFLVKLPGSQILYYWCSEKSKLRGMELLAKIRDLLRRRPSLSCLTGISRSRLDSFGAHLQAYLLGLSNIAEASLAASSNGLVVSSNTHVSECQSSRLASNPSCLHFTAAYTAMAHSLRQGSLTPRLNISDDGMPRTLSSIRKGTCEKLKQHGDSNLSSLTIKSDLATSVSAELTSTVRNSQSMDKELSYFGSSHALQCCLPETPSLSSPLLFNPISVHLPSCQLTVPSSKLSPYYCWCPPFPSSMQFAVAPSHPEHTSSESLPLPSLSTLLSAHGPTASFISSKLPIDVGLQAIIPDPLFPVALPVSSLTLTGSQHIPTFVPFMSDPIVHIPVIDVCSSGQGYLVSAGPTMSSSIPPLLPAFVNPLIPKAESPAEKSARETLQMLLASAPSPFNSQMANVLPVVLNDADTKFYCGNVSENASVALGSGALCDCETLNMSAAANDLPCVASNLSENGIVLDQVNIQPNDMINADDPMKN